MRIVHHDHHREAVGIDEVGDLQHRSHEAVLAVAALAARSGVESGDNLLRLPRVAEQLDERPDEAYAEQLANPARRFDRGLPGRDRSLPADQQTAGMDT